MNEDNETIFTADDFNLICRVCLQYQENMVDVFESGLVNQIMELTNLEVTLDDKLPKTLCNNCCVQVDNLFKFQQQAKSSDTYLRSLLEIEKSDNSKNVMEESPEKGDVKASKEISKKESTNSNTRKKIKRKKKESDKMYLIIVPEVGDSDSKENTDIYIKDINRDSDGLEISHLCNKLFKNNFSDHNYPKHPICESFKEISDKNEIQFVDDESQSESVSPENIESVYHDTFDENKVFNVNMVIFECDECNEKYEDITDLSNHYLVRHGHEPLMSEWSYKCPVCSSDETEKEDFYSHLQNHKNEGYLFVKINSNGEKIPLKESEGHVFVDSNLEVQKICKIFKLNLSIIKCKVCSAEIESNSLISDHLKLCSSNEDLKSKVYVKHTCPVCQISFLDNEDGYIEHLILHKKENSFYIKVDTAGQPVEVADDDQLFVPINEAMEVMKTLSQASLVKIFHVIDVNSCSNCDYVAESYNLLLEHCNSLHGGVLKEPSLVCPVCLEDYNTGNVDECKSKLYNHLTAHRNKGITFVEKKNNGSVSSFNQAHSDVFTNSSIISDLPSTTMAASFPTIWCPELIISSRKNSSRYTCDMCQKQFSSKQDVIKHIKSHQTNYVCEKCGINVSGSKYKKHILRHLNSLGKIGRKPKCTICNKTFASRASLNGHLKYHIKEGLKEEAVTSLFGLICDKCGKSFSNISSLTKHKKKHDASKENSVLKCEICGREFFRQVSLDRHKSAHLNPKYFECEICKLPLSSTMSLQKHVEMHRTDIGNTFDCKTCKVSFLSKESLKAHQAHTGHYVDQKPFECNVCHETFFKGKKFAEHIKTHPKYKMGECTLCGKRLSTVQSLSQHMARHFEANCILCPHCGKQFFEERNYHRHLLTHKGIKPFSCDVETCGKSFYTFFELNRHKKYHLNKRDFRCSFCSKTFHEANHLTVHVRIHTGERPYLCPHCNKGFVTRTRCKQHIKLIHQGIGYDLIQSTISKKVTVFENEPKVVRLNVV